MRIAITRWRSGRYQNACARPSRPSAASPLCASAHARPEVMRPEGWREDSSVVVITRPAAAINGVEMTSSGCATRRARSRHSRCVVRQIVSLIASLPSFPQHSLAVVCITSPSTHNSLRCRCLSDSRPRRYCDSDAPSAVGQLRVRHRRMR